LKKQLAHWDALISAYRNEEFLTDADKLFLQLPDSVQQHSSRVAACMRIIAEHIPESGKWYSFQNVDSFLYAVYCSGIYHELGDLLLQKSMRGGKEETQLREHTRFGEMVMAGYSSSILENQSRRELILDTIRFQYERREEKKKQPAQKEADIPAPARICAAADLMDRLLIENDQKRMSFSSAKAYIQKNADTLFIGRVVERMDPVWNVLQTWYDAY
jgi:HD-GYP domain-containing protein (c-di-GMP phosphodiesterase class II)